MPITMATVDNLDGTGIVATVAGSTGGSTNTLTYSAWTGNVGTLSFSAGGTRVGDGTIAVSPGVGTYIWKLVNSVASETVIVYQAVTGGASAAAQAVLYRSMVQMQTQIVALALTGITSTNVLIKWLPRSLDSTTDPIPCVVICPAPMPEKDSSYLINTDHVGYPVLVACLAAQNQDYTANLNRNLLWREKIRHEFISQGLVGIPEVAYCTVEPQSVINPAWFQKNTNYSAQVFRLVSREQRGN